MVTSGPRGAVAPEPAALHAQSVADELKKCGVSHVVWLPDSESNFMYKALQEDPALTLVPVCREGETMAVAAGLIMGGQKPVALIQNTGFFESGDSIRGLCLDLKLPLLLMLGYRGFEKDAPMTDSAAIYLEPVLKTFGIPYYIVAQDRDLPQVSRAFREAQEGSRTVAILIVREYD